MNLRTNKHTHTPTHAHNPPYQGGKYQNNSRWNCSLVPKRTSTYTCNWKHMNMDMYASAHTHTEQTILLSEDFVTLLVVFCMCPCFPSISLVCTIQWTTRKLDLITVFSLWILSLWVSILSHWDFLLFTHSAHFLLGTLFMWFLTQNIVREQLSVCLMGCIYPHRFCSWELAFFMFIFPLVEFSIFYIGKFIICPFLGGLLSFVSGLRRSYSF